MNLKYTEVLTIEQYGVRLTRLQKDDIELVRFWRNQDFVLSNMEYKKIISEEEQAIWFESINNASNYYFIIEFENQKIGLINAKNYDKSKGFGEGGIFIGNQKYLNSVVSTFSTLCILNAVFFEFKIATKSVIKVLNHNLPSIEYNKLIGYKALEQTNDGISTQYELTLENYTIYGAKLNQAAEAIAKQNCKIKISGSPSPLNAPEINDYLTRQMFR